MYHTGVYELIVQKDDFDVLSADAQFYSHIEKYLYRTFDKMLKEKDREVFYSKAKIADGTPFLIQFTNAIEMTDSVIMTIVEGKAAGTLFIQCIAIKDVNKIIKNLQNRISEQKYLLELHGDICFEYNPIDKMIRAYDPQKGIESAMVYSVDKWEELLLAGALPHEKSQVMDFVGNMQKGIRHCTLKISTKLFERSESGAYTVFEALALYEGSNYIKTIGYVHMGNSRHLADSHKAEVDALTGLLTREEIIREAVNYIDVKKRKDITLAIVDVDYFKRINDTYGHMHGDAVLQEIAEIIAQQLGDTGIAGRIGGDEFMIIFFNAHDMEQMRGRLRSIKNTVCAVFPKQTDGLPSVTLSIGCAAYPKDASNYEDLFKLADFALYRAKEKGRNRYIIYDSEKHGELDEIKQANRNEASVDSRGDMSLGDITCAMADKVYLGDYSLQKLLEDYSNCFEISRIMIYGGTPYHLCAMVGDKKLSNEVIKETVVYLQNPIYQAAFDQNDSLRVNDIHYFKERDVRVYDLLKEQGIHGMLQFKFEDKNGKPCILSLEEVNKKNPWNASRFMYYKLLTRLLREYEIA